MLLNLDWWLLKMLEDYLARQPVASWNTVRGVWETSQVNLLCAHLEPFLETWPTSGMMRDGRVFALPMQAHPTTDSESLLLRTPVADETGGGMTSPAMAKAKGQTLRLSGQIVDMVEPGRLPQPLLSTPTTQDSSGKCRDHGGDLLHDVQCGCSRSERRLPTPTTRDYKDGQAEHKRDGVVQTDTVARAVFSGDWGQYAPAIERWETVIGRPAPAPTKPDGRDGSHRLSSAFTEWMMGLPEGWVTGCGLTRNEELKACGNGVVPQQAVLALSILLEGVEL
jgi:DNA (cytosine-5)-methyltransferase 1